VRRAEVGLDVATAAPRLNAVDVAYRLDHLVQLIDQVAGLALDDNLRRRAAPEGDYRCAAGHRLRHHQTEGLLPAERQDQAGRPFVEVALHLAVRLADELDLLAVDERSQHRVEVLLVDRVGIDFAGDQQPPA